MVDYCCKKKEAIKVESYATNSKGNQATTCLTRKKEMSLPFTDEECRHILELLKTKSYVTNHITSISTHDELLNKNFT